MGHGKNGVIEKRLSWRCALLDEEKGQCSVYEARPVQCRTWPFWPENLESPEAWDLASFECEGMVRNGEGMVKEW